MRKEIAIDGRIVERMAAIGCTEVEIATVLGVTDRTIRRRFRAELDRGRGRLCRAIRRWQIQAARKGNVAMLIWLGKQYLGQRDRQEVVGERELEVVERLVFRQAAESQDGQNAQGKNRATANTGTGRVRQQR